MTNSTETEHAQTIKEMFGRIASRYDRMNRIMTGGQDLRWRKQAIRRANLTGESLLLDLGAGTGDLVLEALKQQPACRPVAVDLTLEMINIGRRRTAQMVEELNLPGWACADAHYLPFPDDLFDAVFDDFFRGVSFDLFGLEEVHPYQFDFPGCTAGQLVEKEFLEPYKHIVTILYFIHG